MCDELLKRSIINDTFSLISPYLIAARVYTTVGKALLLMPGCKCKRSDALHHRSTVIILLANHAEERQRGEHDLVQLKLLSHNHAIRVHLSNWIKSNERISRVRTISMRVCNVEFGDGC